MDENCRVYPTDPVLSTQRSHVTWDRAAGKGNKWSKNKRGDESCLKFGMPYAQKACLNPLGYLLEPDWEAGSEGMDW